MTDSYSFNRPRGDGLRDDSSSSEESVNTSVDNTKKETSSNNQKSYKKKTLSYPIARRNDSKTDYLKIEIADYQAPKLNLPAFQDAQGKTVAPDKIGELGYSKIVGGNEGSFALTQGSTSNDFTQKRNQKQIKYVINLPMPRNITDTTGVQYGEASLNPIEAVGLAGGSALMQGDIQNLKEAFKTIAGSGAALNDPNNQQAISAALSGCLLYTSPSPRDG